MKLGVANEGGPVPSGLGRMVRSASLSRQREGRHSSFDEVRHPPPDQAVEELSCAHHLFEHASSPQANAYIINATVIKCGPVYTSFWCVNIRLIITGHVVFIVTCSPVVTNPMIIHCDKRWLPTPWIDISMFVNSVWQVLRLETPSYSIFK